jgi:probable HAF family extracellular repeat protein
MAVESGSASSSRRIRILLVVGALALCSSEVPTQSPPALTFGVMDLGTLGGAASAGLGVDEFAGTIVGRSRTASGSFHAFGLADDGLVDLGTLGGAQSVAFDAYFGHVVGQSQTASGEEHAFGADLSRTPVTLTDFGTLGGTFSAAYGINASGIVGASRTAGNARLRAFHIGTSGMAALPFDWGGDSEARDIDIVENIVGYACTAGNASCRAFLFNGGSVTRLGSLGGNSVGNGVNTWGEVAGTSFTTGSTTRAFRYAEGTMTSLGTLGGQNSEGLDINEFGDIVGSAQNAAGESRAFVWRDGVMMDLNTLIPAGSGWVLQRASAISEGGQIVGTGTRNGVSRGFLLTPPVDIRLSPAGVRTQAAGNYPNRIEVGKTTRIVLSVEAGDRYGVTIRDGRLTDTLTGPAEFVDVVYWTGGRGEDVCEMTPKVVTCDLGIFDSPSLGREIWLIVKATGPGEFSHHAVVTTSAPEVDPSNNTVTQQNAGVALSTLALTPSTLPGGKASSARVTLTGEAPQGDAVVRLTSSRPEVAAVPPYIVVPVWATNDSRAFNIVPAVVSAPTPVQITATFGQVSVTRTLTVVPPVLTQLYLTPTTVIGGCGTSAGKIVLSGSAPAGGAVVPLTNTNARATVPASIVVGGGTSVKTFTIPTDAVTSIAQGDVTASFGGVSQKLRLYVRPIRARAIAFSPNPVRGGTAATGTVTLECPAAPGPIVVSLTSSTPAVAAPTVTSVTIPAGGTSATFSLRTTAVTSSTNVTINAWVFGVRRTASLTVQP